MSITVDFPTFGEVEVFAGVALVGLDVTFPTFHEIETFESVSPPVMVSIPTFHEIEVMQGGTPYDRTFSVVRWIFEDPLNAGETWTMPMNPNKMTTPYRKHTTTTTAFSPITGMATGVRSNDTAVEWSFSGDIADKDLYDQFIYWTNKPHRIYITDHLGRKWLCWVTKFDPTPKSTGARSKWRFTYTMSVLNYGRQGAPR